MSAGHAVVAFWREAGPGKWFNGGEAFDRECLRFLDAHHAAARREYEHWQDTPEGLAGLLILLDQIPRNVFRGSGHAFATDGLALHYARCAVARGMDLQVDTELRAFVYLPFEHSEVLVDQHEAVRLFRTLGNAEYDRYALAHLDVIERFGRFPHRNAALGRINTADEQAWLDAGGGF
ncbi:DUF924 domain-containing protein [Luteimonas yindakuii]|uniref:DUF924 domain-containing protein n=1 Tax=Luteimonas yindakuii TaxID=2565782 RepID=A0A4Z1R5T8_9GAMM|nr:DUF924 family protein [Luteimonas yindakuii]TKS54982.1 DUF924 domain-containing protein [Luteimonas yindakuii]